MTTELFQGPVADLKARVDAIITGGATSIQVIPTAEKSWYLIIWS
jgi:hypothetical protein